jgi:hypothetical protein
MSRNGSGTYNLPAGNPVVTGTTITTTWANTTLNDIASALTGSIASDGQTPMSASLNMANNKVISVTDPTSAQDAATKAYVDLVAGGTKNGSFVNLAYTGTLTGGTGIVNLGSGQVYKDASGNVGIGTSSPVDKLNVSDGTATFEFKPLSGSGVGYFGMRTNHALAFTTNDVERMRIASGGSVVFGSASYSTAVNNTEIASTGISNTTINGFNLALNKPTGDPQTAYLTFFWNGGLVGYVSYNGSGVTYNTTSDIRLKENIVESPSATSIIQSLKVRSFDWKESNKHDNFGFVAQELYEVYPNAVTKQKNKEDGTMDMPWGVDYSKLVPVLVKTIQEQQAMIEELKTKVLALEAK